MGFIMGTNYFLIKSSSLSQSLISKPNISVSQNEIYRNPREDITKVLEYVRAFSAKSTNIPGKFRQ